MNSKVKCIKSTNKKQAFGASIRPTKAGNKSLRFTRYRQSKRNSQKQELVVGLSLVEWKIFKTNMLIPSALRFMFENRHKLHRGGSVLDFGDQRLFDANHAETIFPEFKKIAAGKDDYERVSILYKLLGLGERNCLDYNENADIRMNLNYTAISNPNIESKFDLVTNQGFSEHVFNQYAAFEAIHHACKPDGVMMHVLPCQGWADGGGWGHGFYQYQPNFFRNLAEANRYEVIDMQISPFSPDPFIFKYNNEEYNQLVNFHMTNKEYVTQRRLGRAIYISLLVLLEMPSNKGAFKPPHE